MSTMDQYLETFYSSLLHQSAPHSLYHRINENALLICIVLTLAIFLYFYKKYTHWSKQGIKGPTPIPPFGTVIYELIYGRSDAFRRWGNKYGSVYGIYSGVKPILVVSDADIIKDLMIKDSHIFPNHMNLEFLDKWTKSMLFQLRDDHWKQLRSLMAFTMTSGKIKKIFGLMKSSCDELIRHISAATNEKIDIRVTYACFTLDVIARAAFAMKLDSEESETKYRTDLITKIQKNSRIIPYFRMTMVAFFPKFLLNAIGFKIVHPSMRVQLAAISRNIIEFRRKNPSYRKEDFLQILMDLNKSGVTSADHTDTIEGDIKESHHVENYDKKELQDAIAETKLKGSDGLSMAKRSTQVSLNDDEIIANCILFILAGFETTSSLLSFATYALACHPDFQEQLYQEVKSKIERESGENPKYYFEYETVLSMQFLDAVISETLRMFSPFQTTDRQANADYKIKSLGVTIAENETVLVQIASVHYNPNYYEEPHAFKPIRFLPENRHKLIPYTYLPFGAGIRHCLGMRFALAEAKLALARTVYEFKLIPSKGAQASFPPKIARSFGLIRSDDLNVVFTKR